MVTILNISGVIARMPIDNEIKENLERSSTNLAWLRTLVEAMREIGYALGKLAGIAPSDIHVLMVDDSIADWRLAQYRVDQALENNHCSKKILIEHCKSYHEAFHKLPNGKYSCLLIDWSIHEHGDGLRLAKELLLKGVRTPMLMFSGVDEAFLARQQEEMLDAGLLQFVDKNYTGHGELARRILAAIKSKK